MRKTGYSLAIHPAYNRLATRLRGEPRLRLTFDLILCRLRLSVSLRDERQLHTCGRKIMKAKKHLDVRIPLWWPSRGNVLFVPELPHADR